MAESHGQPQQLAGMFFPDGAGLGELEPVGRADLSPDYVSLLSHHDHMTVTQEAWHNSLVDLRVLNEHITPEAYARESILCRQRDGGVVQYGIMRILLAGLPEIVRLEILSRALPLGRVLIRHHLLREVELQQLWRVIPGKRLRLLLGLEPGENTFGRTARILVDGRPAVELLEIVKL